MVRLTGDESITRTEYNIEGLGQKTIGGRVGAGDLQIISKTHKDRSFSLIQICKQRPNVTLKKHRILVKDLISGNF